MLEDVDVVALEVVDEDEVAALVEVVEELAALVDGVEEVVWLVVSVCDWVVVLFVESELRAKYPPTAATMITTTTTPITAVLTALRLSRANEGLCPVKRLLRPNFSRYPNISDVYMTSHRQINLGRGKVYLERRRRGRA